MLRQMLAKDALRRASSFELLSRFRAKFDAARHAADAPQVKYSPVKTISKIELTEEQSQQAEQPRMRKYSPEMNLSTRGKIK